MNWNGSIVTPLMTIIRSEVLVHKACNWDFRGSLFEVWLGNSSGTLQHRLTIKPEELRSTSHLILIKDILNAGEAVRWLANCLGYHRRTSRRFSWRELLKWLFGPIEEGKIDIFFFMLLHRIVKPSSKRIMQSWRKRTSCNFSECLIEKHHPSIAALYRQASGKLHYQRSWLLPTQEVIKKKNESSCPQNTIDLVRQWD